MFTLLYYRNPLTNPPGPSTLFPLSTPCVSTFPCSFIYKTVTSCSSVQCQDILWHHTRLCGLSRLPMTLPSHYNVIIPPLPTTMQWFNNPRFRSAFRPNDESLMSWWFNLITRQTPPPILTVTWGWVIRPGCWAAEPAIRLCVCVGGGRSGQGSMSECVQMLLC